MCSPHSIRGTFWCPSTIMASVRKLNLVQVFSTQFSSFAQSSPTLCDSMDCNMPGFPVHYQHLKITQTHVHQVGDAIQPSHPLSSLLLLPSILPSIRVFSNKSVLHIRWPKFSFSISPSNEYSGLIPFRNDWFDLLAVQGIRDSLESCPLPQFKSINS